MRILLLNIMICCFVFITANATSGSGAEFFEEAAQQPDTVTVKVLGTHADSRFEPEQIHVNVGDIVRFEVVEGMHTVTAYHPDNRRELSIPEGASSFDSGALTAGDIWHLEITHEGEYNYFCMPHERLGHVGKIISNQTVLNSITTNL